MRKLKLVLSLTNKKKYLLMEAYLFLAWARILKGLPFSKIAPVIGEQMQETSMDVQQDTRRNAAEISEAIYLMSKYTFWESECLVKALAAMKMLERRQLESTLYLGTAKDEKEGFIAHAWLRSGPYYVTGAEGMERFTVVNTFAKNV